MNMSAPSITVRVQQVNLLVNATETLRYYQ